MNYFLTFYLRFADWRSTQTEVAWPHFLIQTAVCGHMLMEGDTIKNEKRVYKNHALL